MNLLYGTLAAIERLLGKEPLNRPIGLDWDEAQWTTDVARINDWAISKQQLSGLIKTFKANCRTGYVPQAIPLVPISLFIAADTLTETASGLEMERLRAPLKRQADWG